MEGKNTRQAIFILIGLLQFIPWYIASYYSDVVFKGPAVAYRAVDYVDVLLFLYFCLVSVVYRLLGKKVIPSWLFCFHAILSIFPYLFLGWVSLFSNNGSSVLGLRFTLVNLFVNYGYILAQIFFVAWVLVRSRRIAMMCFVVVFFASCKSDDKFSMSVSDFRHEQQLVLKRILSDGFAEQLRGKEESLFTHTDLLRLSQAESPLLRAVALDELKWREETRFGDIAMGHLDDTAIVLHDHGEFGLAFETVTDVALELSKWPDSISRMTLVTKLLDQPYKHRSLYITLRSLDTIPSFYRVIRQMAFQSTTDRAGHNARFNEQENALYALAKFRRYGDAELINDEIARHPGLISNVSLNLMRDFPDTSFLDFLEYYHRRFFYRIIDNQTDGFSGYHYDKVNAESFVEAVAAQHNNRGALILDTMMQRLPMIECSTNLYFVIDKLENAIGKDQGEAFAWLRKKYRLPRKKVDKFGDLMHMESIDLSKDSSARVFIYHPWR